MHPVFLRQRGGGLTFQIEMLLSADLERTFNDKRGTRDGFGSVAFGPDDRAQLEPAVGCQGLFDGQKGRFFGIGDLGQSGGLSRRMMRGCGHHKHRLADVMHRAHGQKRLVMHRRRAVGHVGKIGGGPDALHAGRCARDGQIKRGDSAMGNRRQTKGQMQGPGGKRKIVQIARLPGYMQGRGIMGKGLAECHACTSSTFTAAPFISWK